MDRFIPWTGAVKDQKTDFHAQPIDLVPFLRENREMKVASHSARKDASRSHEGRFDVDLRLD